MHSVCVQVWRARSSQALHAYITFVCRAHAQWAATQLHGRKGTHTWNLRVLRAEDIGRCARPPTEEERTNAKGIAAGNAGNGSANASSGAANKLVFSPTAVIIPFYATLLSSTDDDSALTSSSLHLEDGFSARSNATPKDALLTSHAPQTSNNEGPQVSASTTTPSKPAWSSKTWRHPSSPMPSFSSNPSLVSPADDNESHDQPNLKTPQLRLAPPTPPSPSVCSNAEPLNSAHSNTTFLNHSEPTQSQLRPHPGIRSQSQPAVPLLDTLLPDPRDPSHPKHLKRPPATLPLVQPHHIRPLDSNDLPLPREESENTNTKNQNQDDNKPDTNEWSERRPRYTKRAVTMIEMSLFAHQPVIEHQDTSFEVQHDSQPQTSSATTSTTRLGSIYQSTTQDSKDETAHDYFSASHHAFDQTHAHIRRDDGAETGQTRVGDMERQSRSAFDPFGEAGQLQPTLSSELGSISTSRSRSRSPHPHPHSHGLLVSKSAYDRVLNLNLSNLGFEPSDCDSHSHRSSLGVHLGSEGASEGIQRSMPGKVNMYHGDLAKQSSLEGNAKPAIRHGSKGLLSGGDSRVKVKRDVFGDASNLRANGENTLSLSDRVGAR